MQLYDTKWLHKMENMGVTIWLLCRYMDDSRVFMPEIKAGWRWDSGSLVYCKDWEEEDKGKSGVIRTKEILLQSFQNIEDYLQFTVETGEDPEFSEGWLPTLDTSMKINDRNQVLFKYYEKQEDSPDGICNGGEHEDEDPVK